MFVQDVMTRRPVTVRGDTDVAEAVELMTSTTVKSLPVVDEHGRVVGVVSRRDVVHALARPDDEGRVVVDGPVSARDRTIATTTVTTVPGVRSVHLAEEERGWT